MDGRPCGICGRTVEENPSAQEKEGVFQGWKDVPLKDGTVICRECAEQARILYPLRSSKVFAESSTRFGTIDHYGKSIPGKGWVSALIDPLRDMTLADFQKALADAAQAAQARAAQFPGAKGAAEADFTFRHYIPAPGTQRKPEYTDKKVFVTCVKVLYGEIRPGDMVSVFHKDREYAAKAEDVWFWNYLDDPQRPIDRAFAGVTAALWFHQELPVYPGDILIVKGN